MVKVSACERPCIPVDAVVAFKLPEKCLYRSTQFVKVGLAYFLQLQQRHLLHPEFLSVVAVGKVGLPSYRYFGFFGQKEVEPAEFIRVFAAFRNLAGCHGFQRNFGSREGFGCNKHVGIRGDVVGGVVCAAEEIQSFRKGDFLIDTGIFQIPFLIAVTVIPDAEHQGLTA